ncbi:MAG: deoxyribonuclease V, partial [Gammaproteobacteria bacterium]|nr:deoxyribonuclease V [Gammaproteobacteria bacterium]
MKKVQASHSWNVSPSQAISIQNELRSQVVREGSPRNIRYIAGVDTGFEDNNTVTRSAIVVMTFPDLEIHEHVIARRPTSFPYVPGLLSFREIPCIADAFEKLNTTPDLLLCDGMGIAHPRRFGIACHLGVLTDLPSIGVGKSLLIGKHQAVPDKRGEAVDLIHKGEVIGAVLRTREKVKPV